MNNCSTFLFLSRIILYVVEFSRFSASKAVPPRQVHEIAGRFTVLGIAELMD